MYDPNIGGGMFFCNTSMSAFGELLMADNKETLTSFLYWWQKRYGDPRLPAKNMEIQEKIYKNWLLENDFKQYKYIFGD